MSAYTLALLVMTAAGAALATWTHDAVPIAWTVASLAALAAELHARRSAPPTTHSPESIIHYAPAVRRPENRA